MRPKPQRLDSNSTFGSPVGDLALFGVYFGMYPLSFKVTVPSKSMKTPGSNFVRAFLYKEEHLKRQAQLWSDSLTNHIKMFAKVSPTGGRSKTLHVQSQFYSFIVSRFLGVRPIVAKLIQGEYHNCPPQIFLIFSGLQDSSMKRFPSTKLAAEIHFYCLNP